MARWRDAFVIDWASGATFPSGPSAPSAVVLVQFYDKVQAGELPWAKLFFLIPCRLLFWSRTGTVGRSGGVEPCFPAWPLYAPGMGDVRLYEGPRAYG